MKKTKQILSALIVLCMLLAVAPMATYATEAGGTCGDSMTWQYDNATKTLTISGTGDMNDYSYSYSASAPWKNYISEIAIISIGDGVTSIGTYAFYYCQGLTSVTIPGSVISIGKGAFDRCSSLTSVIIQNGVTSIGDGALNDCTGLTSVTIPGSVTSIGENAFLNCNKLNEVNYIGSEADWDAITKGAGYSIDDSIIIYCKGIKAERSDDEIVVTPLNIENGKIVILALYDSDKFVKKQLCVYNGAEITFTPTVTYTRAMVMVWESLDSMSPVCGSKTVK